MGYENRMRVVKLYRPDDEIKTGKPQLEGEGNNAYAYRPYKKDGKGNFIKTGRKEIICPVIAMLDLCNVGSGPLSVLIGKSENKDKNTAYKYFASDGNNTIEEDSYGTRFKPVSIASVVEALEKECKVLDYCNGTKPYHRFVWALALLKSFEDRGEDCMVLFEGY